MFVNTVPTIPVRFSFGLLQRERRRGATVALYVTHINTDFNFFGSFFQIQNYLFCRWDGKGRVVLTAYLLCLKISYTFFNQTGLMKT